MRMWMRLVAAASLAATGAAAYVLACGPFVTNMRPVETVRPGQFGPYNRGDLGVVREHFARRFLVQAYRRFTGRPAITVIANPDPAVVRPFVPAADTGPIKQWRDLHQQIVGSDVTIDTDRRIAQYRFVTNCLDGAFTSAVATGRARVDKYGAGSPVVRDWFRAQDAVLINCSGDGVTLPDAAPANADALVRADRAYQIAAANFYAMRFDDAARGFRQIAADASSPWRPYGRYLTGRALLRGATIPENLDRQKMLAAREEFTATLADRDAAVLHASAKGLLQLITFRIEPAQLLADMSPAIAGGETVSAAQLDAYERLMDAILGDVATFPYDGVAEREAIGRAGEMNDWILVMQGTGDAAAARAVEQWKRTKAPAWLVASLWKIPAKDADAPAVLEAASHVDAASPAFLTVAFLRVRLLAERGETDQARALLATLPKKARDAADAEAVNLLTAERFMLARSLEELLEAAPRVVVSKRLDIDSWNEIPDDKDPAALLDRPPVFDDDAGIVFSLRLPLSRLVEASTSQTLPARLRLRVASATFARAWMLGRDDAAIAVAPVIRELSPSAAADVKKFEAAAPADRHIAGLRLLLRTPGLRANVRGLEDDDDYAGTGLARDFDHLFRRNWWCPLSGGDRDFPTFESASLSAIYRQPPGQTQSPAPVVSPSFVTADERAAVQRELQAMAALGTAPNYLAAEAVKWAKARPADEDAAEALAHAVEGTRWGCADARTSAASKAAFSTLHQLFPKSPWAQKTKYWY